MSLYTYIVSYKDSTHATQGRRSNFKRAHFLSEQDNTQFAESIEPLPTPRNFADSLPSKEIRNFNK